MAGDGRGGGHPYRPRADRGWRYQTAKSGTILRGGGPADYFEITPEQLFKMYRPR
jgi:hypothetical protein